MNVTLEQQIERKQKELADLRRKQQRENEKKRARLGAMVEKIFEDLPKDETGWEVYLMTVKDAAKRMSSPRTN